MIRVRGQQERSGSLFSWVSIEDLIPTSHPLRRIRKLADQALDRRSPSFGEQDVAEGRPPGPLQQRLLAAMLQTWASPRWRASAARRTHR